MAEDQSTEDQTNESASLLDQGEAPPPPADPLDNVVPQKFQTEDGTLDADKVLKSYTELEKMMGSFQGAPDQYELNVPDGIVLDDAANVKDDPRIGALAKVAKELNMGQKGFDQLLAAALEAESVHQAGLQQAEEIDKDRELARLGPNAKERLAMVGSWLQNSLNEGAFQYARQNIAQTAEGAMFLEQMMQLAKGSTKIPTNVTGDQPLSAEEMFSTADMERYIKDPSYRKAMQAKAGMR